MIIDKLEWAIVLAAIGALGGFVVLLHVIYFYFNYQKPIDKKVMGGDYYEMGILLASTKLMMYGHYCLFPKRAKKAGVHEIFSTIPRNVKAHLIVHWVLVIVFSCMLFGGATVDYLQSTH